jgi:uncharacterized DUF497 family protein
MTWPNIIWDPSPGGNVEHIEEHGREIEDVQHVLEHYDSTGVSRSTGSPCVFGYTPDGRYITVVYEEVDGDTIVPVTAYDVPEP